MARIAGTTGVVTWDANAHDGVTKWTLTVEDDTPDATGMDSGAWKEHVSGLKGWTADVSMHYDTDDVAQYQGAPPDISAGKSATLILLTHTAGLTYTGTATLKTFTPTVNVDGTVDVECSFLGNGALTYPSA